MPTDPEDNQDEQDGEELVLEVRLPGDHRDAEHGKRDPDDAGETGALVSPSDFLAPLAAAYAAWEMTRHGTFQS